MQQRKNLRKAELMLVSLILLFKSLIEYIYKYFVDNFNISR